MTSANPKKPPGTNLSPRFLKPETTVAERIDQLTLAHPDEQDLRQEQGTAGKLAQTGDGNPLER